MSGPAKWAWPIWVGNDEPFTFTLKDAVGARLDLTGTVLVLRISAQAGPIILTSGIDAGLAIASQADPITKGQFTVRLSLEQTRLLPANCGTRYEIEQRKDGRELTLLYGEITATAWENGDG